MLLAEDQIESAFRIQAYQPGKIVINDQSYTSSVIITADYLITDWEPNCVSELEDQHLAFIHEIKPEVVIFGTGEKQDFSLMRKLDNIQIGYEIMNTVAARRTHSVLLAEGRKFAMALML